MRTKPLLGPILDDDALTRGLGDPEARILIEWLVERTEMLAEYMLCEASAQREVHKLCRRARAISRFVGLWCLHREWGAAGQLAAAERFTWPLPNSAADPCELMEAILDWETRHLNV